MKVYLLRHGEAVSDRVDPKRPLSEKGREEVSIIAKYMHKQKENVYEIWHSPKLRAKQTAEIVYREACHNAMIVERTGLLPNDDPGDILPYIEAEKDSIMVVSHLPFLGYLCAKLTASSVNTIEDKITTATIICLESMDDEWKIEYIMSPSML